MPLTHIFHLSDLHIRNGDTTYSRYEEYNAVFNNTIISINSNISRLHLAFDDFIIVITGDIFHNKNVIGNYGLYIYRQFIQSLSNIGRTYIISGNHDYDQSDPDKPSLVYSSTFDIPNVFVLNNSTSFVIDDIGFSFVSIDKTLDKYRNSGRIQDLPPFPVITEPVKYKIAMFHGSFASAKLFNGKTMEETYNPYPLEWVEEFDYVLLGDIHKRQVFKYKKKTICGYSGSLIQQNFGEDIIEHGYLLWNLGKKNKKTKEIDAIEQINVYNNIGYINILEDSSQNILIRTNGKYTESLETYIKTNIKYFPKILEIKSFTNINHQSLCTILNAFDISFQIVSKINNPSQTVLERIHIQSNERGDKGGDGDGDKGGDGDGDGDNDRGDGDNGTSVCSLDTNYLLVYFKKLLTDDKYKILLQIIKDKETLLFDIHKYPEDLHQECIKRNKDLEPLISLCNEADDTQVLKKSFLIKYLEWGGLLCYENKCSINFKDLDAKTFMIKGANGTGKSAIYDILQLAIWATNNKFDTYSAGFINHNKKSGYTIVDIEVGDITYRIKREFSKKKGSFKITTKSSVLYKFGDKVEAPELLVLKKDSACNMEVKALFGDINTFLSTSMITQSIDNDILGLNYKDTLATLDKSHNIQFIYNLYNLFKTSINKYKDFRKVIQSKKEVYEKLLFNGKNNDVNGEIISRLAEELSSSNIERSLLLKEYDSINVDINNPNCQAICDTDYTALINDILENPDNPDNPIVDEEVYEKYKEEIRHYRYLYSIMDNNKDNNKDKLRDMRRSSKLYSQELEEDFKSLPCINKPCEESYLHTEEKALGDYIDILDSLCITESLVNQKEDLVKNKIMLNELVSNKPNKVSTEYRNQHQHKERDIDTLTSVILKIFGDTNTLKEFISAYTKPPVISPKQLKQLKATISDCDPITIDGYTNALRAKEALEDDMCNIKNQIMSLEKEFNSLFSKQQKLTTVNIPNTTIASASASTTASASASATIPCNKQLNTVSSIAKEIQKYNVVIGSIDSQIADDELLMNQYHQKIQEITKLDIDIENYNKELNVLSTNEEYKYNPECCVCCNRPWVCRIKEVGIIVNTLNVARMNVNYSADDHAIVKERLAENTRTKATYNLLNEWFNYYKFKEAFESLSKDLNNIIMTKNNLQERLTSNTEELQKTTIYTDYFLYESFMLFEELNNIHLSDTYKVWESSYNVTKMYIEELEKSIHLNENIKPRIAKYKELKKTYDDWEQYARNKKIIDSYHYYRLKKVIEVTDLYNGYQNNARLKPLIKRKMELNEMIDAITLDTKKMNDRMVEYTTINAYNNENKSNYNALFEIDGVLANIIDVLDTILINFQSFRKELYDNLILNKLVEKANKIIKTLCHTNTKPFKLNYNVEISNDTVHINWLIHNVNISSECDKQYISVSQASGFQRFAISLALRMSLYFNNYDILCGQLFIDEGFINFDKNNLSVVPTFLKSLLHYFNTIVILSHIDVIQDSVDETAEIRFNNASGVSSIVYK